MNLSNAWPYDLVEIVWLDASGDTGWRAESDIKESHTLVSTIGFVIRKTRKHYLMGSSVFWDEEGEEHNFGDRNHIPRGMVKSVLVLVPKNTQPMKKLDEFGARVAPGGNA